MKNAILFISISLLTFFTNEAIAKGNPNTQDLSVTIKKMIGNPKILDRNFTEEQFVVQFMITPENQVIVLRTGSQRFDSYIKRQLNYKKLQLDNSIEKKVYSLPVTIRKD